MALLKHVYAIHPAQSTIIVARTVWFIYNSPKGLLPQPTKLRHYQTLPCLPIPAAP